MGCSMLRDLLSVNQPSNVFFEIEGTSVVSHKSLYSGRHSGLDPESSLSALDSRFCGNDGLENDVKKR